MARDTTMPDHIRATANDTLRMALRRFGACDESLDWIYQNQFASIQEAWDECTRPDWMMHYYCWQTRVSPIPHEFYAESFQYLWKETGSKIDIQPWIVRARTEPSCDKDRAHQFLLDIYIMLDSDPDQESRRQKRAVATAIATYASMKWFSIINPLHYDYFYNFGPHHDCDVEWADIVRKYFPVAPEL